MDPNFYIMLTHGDVPLVRWGVVCRWIPQIMWSTRQRFDWQWTVN